MLSTQEINDLKERLSSSGGPFYRGLAKVTGLSRTTLSSYFNHRPISSLNQKIIIDGSLVLLKRSEERSKKLLQQLQDTL